MMEYAERIERIHKELVDMTVKVVIYKDQLKRVREGHLIVMHGIFEEQLAELRVQARIIEVLTKE